MRILLCHKHTDITGISGGFSTVYFNLGRCLAALGHEVTILSQHDVHSTDGPRFMQVDVANQDPVGYAASVAQIARSLMPDIVECPSWAAECSVLAGESGAPPIVVRGDIPAEAYGETEAARRERELMLASTLAVAVSRAMAATLWETYGVVVDRVIYHGVDTRIFRPQPQRRRPCSNTRERRIVWVGRPSFMKGFDLLRQVIECSPAEFSYDLVLGRSKYELPLETSGQAHVRLHRELSLADLVALYNECDVILSTSRIEGFGLAVLEAMACGTPAVVPATSGGLTEVATPGEGSVQFRDITEVIGAVWELTHRDGRQATARARWFAWEKCAQETVAAYTEAIRIHSFRSQCRRDPELVPSNRDQSASSDDGRAGGIASSPDHG